MPSAPSAATQAQAHGGFDAEELDRMGISAQQVIDFSVNSNPYGPSPAVLDAMTSVEISVYPDRQCFEFKTALAQAANLSTEKILVGNGTAELIWLSALAFLKPGDEVVVLGPTFGEYERSIKLAGATLHEVRASAPDFTPPIEQLARTVQERKPRLVFICNPNNPTGKFLSNNELQPLFNVINSETILVWDQAYESFVNGEFFPTSVPHNCILMRSMTKEFALAGVRLGYAVGDEHLIAKLAHLQPAWSVNAFAQAAGMAVLESLDYYSECMKRLAAEKTRFFAQLEEVGAHAVPTDVHYGIIPTKQTAYEVRTALLRKLVQVRDCTSFGLPHHIRVSTQTAEDNQKLIEALASLGEI